jgi:hypothetical protein
MAVVASTVWSTISVFQTERAQPSYMDLSNTGNNKHLREHKIIGVKVVWNNDMQSTRLEIL